MAGQEGSGPASAGASAKTNPALPANTDSFRTTGDAGGELCALSSDALANAARLLPASG